MTPFAAIPDQPHHPEQPAADPQALRDALALTLARSAGVDPTRDSGPATLVRLVGLTVRAEGEVRSLVRQTVGSARAAGASWDAIGAELGMSRQAAQQRFGRLAGDGATAAVPAGGSRPERRRLTGVSAVNEMRELDVAGRHGWHSVELGAMHHLLERSDTQWEHRRVGLVGPTRSRLGRAGWQEVGTWFPWVYLKRDLGVPAIPEVGD